MKQLRYLLVMMFCQLAAFICHGQVIDTVCPSLKGEVYHVKRSPGSVYLWTVEGGEIKSSQGNDSIVVDWGSVPGLYSVKVLEISSHGCPGDTVTALIKVSDSVYISGPKEICRGEYVLLEAQGAKQYEWSTGEKTSSILIQPDSSKLYYVVGRGTGCADDTAYFFLKVNDKPKADFSFLPQEPRLEENISFQYAGQNGSSWEWIFNDSQIVKTSDLNPSFIFHNAGLRKVSLVVQNGSGCSDTITYTFYLKREAYIFVPTAFTPDGDGLNDVFKTVGMGIKYFDLAIFNRWGERVFQTNNMEEGWDGTYKGEYVEDGVYVYRLSAQGIDGQWHYLKGNITVLR